MAHRPRPASRRTSLQRPAGRTASPGIPFGDPPPPPHASACTCGPTCPEGLIDSAPTPLAGSPQFMFVSKATCMTPSAVRAKLGGVVP